jgi:hypothetical protein
MIELNLDDQPTLQVHASRTVYVQDEPALEIALPQVFDQPPLHALQRGKLPNVEALVARLQRRQQAEPQGALGLDYQLLVAEFQPLFAWTTACWDYLLSTEGCRFVPRQGEPRLGIRGDYRAVTYPDYSRIVHAIFRECVFEFARQPAAPSLSQWLRERLWPLVVEMYRRLEQPADPRQRILTPYSYLRCVPYQFLNDFHHELVHTTLLRLLELEQRVVDAYFLHFYTEAASAETVGCPVETLQGALRQALVKLLIRDRLVYCLLRQIERY